MNFFNFSLPVAIIGWINMKKRLGVVLAIVLGSMTAINFLFFIRYPIPDQFTFILPSLIMLSIAGAVGISVLSDISKNWRNTVIALCLLRQYRYRQ